MHAGFGLEPLAGEVRLKGVSGCGSDAAEGKVAGGPDFHARIVAGIDWPADVVGADVADDAAFDDGNRFLAVPDVFADQGPGGFVVFGDSSFRRIDDGMDRDRRGRSQGADGLPPQRVVFVTGLQNPVHPEFRQPPCGIVGVAVATACAVIQRHTACHIIAERAQAARRKGDGAKAIRSIADSSQ